MSVKQDLESALTKIEALPADIAADIKAGIHDLLSKLHLAEGAAEHNVGDVIENSAAAVSNAAAEEQKQIDGVVHAVEGEPAATSATPNPAPLPPATPDAQA